MDDEKISRADARARARGLATFTSNQSLVPPALYAAILRADRSGEHTVIYDREALQEDELVRDARDGQIWSFAAEHGDTGTQLLVKSSRFPGAPVAFVVAPSRRRVYELCNLIQVNTSVVAPVAPKVIPHSRIVEDALVDDSRWQTGPAAHRLSLTFATSRRYHVPVEELEVAVSFEGSRITVYTPTQAVRRTQQLLARSLQWSPDRISVVSEYVGGAFGGRVALQPLHFLAAQAAVAMQRSIRAFTFREEALGAAGFQPATKQTVTLESDARGHLRVLDHDVAPEVSALDPSYVELAGLTTPSMYHSALVSVRTRPTLVDIPTPSQMRSPFGARGSFAIESAVDELALSLGQDPLMWRKNNARDTDLNGAEYVGPSVAALLTAGARAFGWKHGGRSPGNGQGLALGMRPHFPALAYVSCSVDRTGKVVVSSGTQDLGTGTKTVLVQAVRSVLPLPIDQLAIDIGRSAYPPASASTASSTAHSIYSAATQAALSLRDALQQSGLSVDDITRSGKLPIDKYPELIGLEKFGRTEGPPSHRPLRSLAAHFVEVSLGSDARQVDIRRIYSVFSVGPILSAVTARTQALGGLVWGISEAIRESGGDGNWADRVLDYEVARYADVPPIDVAFYSDGDEPPRGLGEIAVVGVAAAIANAVRDLGGPRNLTTPFKLRL